LITETIDQYIAHLRAQRQSEKTIGKYGFALNLMVELAKTRGLSRIDQIDLAFIDAFKLSRNSQRVTSNVKGDHAKGQDQNHPQ
jgi:site-specific recombinase XerC